MSCDCPEINPMCRLGVVYRKEGCKLSEATVAAPEATPPFDPPFVEKPKAKGRDPEAYRAYMRRYMAERRAKKKAAGA